MPNPPVFVLALLACGAWAPITAQPCQPKNLQAATEQVKVQQADLLAFKLQSDTDESVSPPLQAKIRAFKDSLAELADATLACQSSNTEPKKLESSFAKLLDANKPIVQEVYDPKKPPQLDHIYGGEMRVKVSAPTNPPDLLLVRGTRSS